MAILRPRRGKKTTAVSQGLVLEKGEIFFETPETGTGTGAGKIKIGDGVTSYANLPYFNEGVSIGSTTGTALDGKIGNDHIINRSNPHGVTKSQVGLGNAENKSSETIRSEITKANVTTALGYTPPTTNTTYNNATTAADGLMSSSDKTKLNGIATGATANTGTVTGIKMNGVSKGTSGVVDLGTVITSHQDISGKLDKSGGTMTGDIKFDLTYDTVNNRIKRIYGDYYGLAFSYDQSVIIGDILNYSNTELDKISEIEDFTNDGNTSILNDAIFCSNAYFNGAITIKNKTIPITNISSKTISSSLKTTGTITIYQYGLVIYIQFDGVIFNAASGNVASTGYRTAGGVFASHLDSWGGDTAFAYIDAAGALAIGNVIPGVQYWGVVTAPISV